MADLKNVLIDICQRAGYQVADIDVTAISGTVDGFVLSNRSTARAMIEALQKAFFFDTIESEGKVKFIPLNTSPVVNVTTDELISLSGGDNPRFLEIGFSDDAALPRTLSVNYIAKSADYQQGTQEAMRQIADTGETKTVSLAVVLDNTVARQIAETLLYLEWVERVSFSFALTIKYLYLEPGDIITITDGQFSHSIRIRKKRFFGQSIVFEGVASDVSTFSQNVSGGEVDVSSVGIFDPGNTTLQLLDIPLLRTTDNDAGFYLAVGRENARWRGATTFRSADDVSYNTLTSSPTPTIMGTTLTALPDGPHWYMDRVNFVDIELIYNDQLTSTTEANLLDSVNSCVIGDEIVQFQTATLIGTRQYRLTNLLRGRLGSEQHKATHVIGDRFVMLSPGGNLARISDGSSLIGAERYYKPVSVGQDISSVTAQTFTNNARGLKPWAPAHFKGERQSNKDWIFNWLRRPRFGGSWLNNADVPLVEETEEYTVEILNGSTVIRTVIVKTNTLIYTEAQQITDFGSAQSTIKARVAQNSAIIGPGYKSEDTFNG